ncbi:MAG: hypothetical protein AAB617_01975 [Patescibacteria group bacterium]
MIKFLTPLIICFAIITISLPGVGFAQSFNLPQPIKDLYDTTSKINIGEKNSIDVNKIIEKGSEFNPSDVFYKAREIWSNANSWMGSHIGVSLSEIVRGIVGVVVWALEFIIDLFKKLLSFL